mgnify:CR=1 FL=1
MQSSESRETSAALGALNEALWAVCFVRRVRVVWESSFGRLFVFGAIGASGTWQQFARIGWLRGTVEDDEQDRWWEQFFLRVPAFKSLAWDVCSRNIECKIRGNVVEACVGASFLASHELAASRAPAASGATIPRFHFRTEPPEAMAQFAVISSVIEYSGRRH